MNELAPPSNSSSNAAPRNVNSQIVAREVAAHQEAAMLAARMIKFQYSTEAKNRFRRECVTNLKASLSRKHA
ncbi:hypothetical protein ACI2KS_10185 [Pseudomonas sp. NPDC087358]|uniref:hypothetical protein n=1 Tax=Pseudomonas sp. NPDC087358 TaxID=3364439 RepID=UPI0038516708